VASCITTIYFIFNVREHLRRLNAEILYITKGYFNSNNNKESYFNFTLKEQSMFEIQWKVYMRGNLYKHVGNTK
jgi:hypothetical protein